MLTAPATYLSAISTAEKRKIKDFILPGFSLLLNKPRQFGFGLFLCHEMHLKGPDGWRGCNISAASR